MEKRKRAYFFLILFCLPGILSGCKSDKEGGEKERLRITRERHI